MLQMYRSDIQLQQMQGENTAFITYRCCPFVQNSLVNELILYLLWRLKLVTVRSESPPIHHVGGPCDIGGLTCMCTCLNS